MMQLGIGKADITPPFPVPLAGFAGRTADYEGISRPLYVRAWVFVQEMDDGRQSKAILLQADLICWGAERLGELSGKIQKQWNIPAERILFHASHTHGSPMTTGQFSPMLGKLNRDYVEFLERRTEEAIAGAHDNLECVSMERGADNCFGIGINRRKLIDGVAVMAPNPQGLNDQEVTVVRFVAHNARTKGVMFHFTCHPTTTSDNRVTSDYCGAAMEILDRELGDGVSCFVQGCCGDIRPSLLNDDQTGFRSGNDGDVGRRGQALAELVLKVMRRPMSALTPARLRGWTAQAQLPFRQAPAWDDLQPDERDPEEIAAWKTLLRSDPDRLKPTGTLNMQLLQIADELSLLAMDGEIVVEYGLYAKLLSHNKVLPLGYSNGLLGYIPTARQIREGGYESDSSTVYFGFPSILSPRVEANVRRAIEQIVSDAVNG